MRSCWSHSAGIAAAASVLLLLVACTGDDDTGSSEPTEPDTGAATEPHDDDGGSEVGDDEEPDIPDGPHGSIPLSGFDQVHLAGVAIAITGVTVDGYGDIYVEFEAQSSNPRDVFLIDNGVRLEDDLGNTYRRVAPAGDSWLTVPSDTRAEVSLAFNGPIDPDANRISLGLNADEFQDTDATPATTLRPTFTFRDLPLPGVGLDDEAASDDDPVGLDLSAASVTVDDAVHEGPVETRIEIREIRVTPLVVEVDIFARNNSDRSRDLISRSPLLWAEIDGEPTSGWFNYAMLLTDDERRDSMTLEPNEELEATLSFRGSVPDGVTGLRLGIGAITGTHLRDGDGDETVLHPAAVFTGLPVPEEVTDAG